MPGTVYAAVGLVVGQTKYFEGDVTIAYPMSVASDDNDVSAYPFSDYNIVSDDNYLTGSTITTYDSADTPKLVTTSSYRKYDDTTHQQIVNTATVNSRGDTTITTNVYPYDYAPGNAVIDTMVTQHIWAGPIEKYDSLKTINGLKAVTGGQLNRYRFDSYFRSVVPDNISTLSAGSLLTGFTPSAVGSGNLTADAQYTQMISFDAYDNNNNIIQYIPCNSAPVSIIWDYLNNLPVAKVKNAAAPDVIAYTSFEADGYGNWHFSGTPVRDATAPTGSMCYPLSSGNVSSSYFYRIQVYKLPYWSNNGDATQGNRF